MEKGGGEREELVTMLCMCVHVCTCVYMCVCVCTCVCLCEATKVLHTHTHTIVNMHVDTESIYQAYHTAQQDTYRTYNLQQ